MTWVDTSMKAWRVHEFGPPEAMKLQERSFHVLRRGGKLISAVSQPD